MAGSRRTRSSRRRVGRYMWSTSQLGQITTIPQNTQALTRLLQDIEQDVYAGAVITRTVGIISIRAIGEDQDIRATWALLQMSADAFSAGAAPEIGFDDPAYLWLDSATQRTGTPTGSSPQWFRYQIDSSAKRKIRSQDMRYVFMTENISDVANSYDYDFQIRTLLYIP